MIVAKIKVTGAKATKIQRDIITAGMVGAQVHIDYADPLWDDLRKTVVFDGAVCKDVITDSPDVEIPPECIAKPIQFFRVGVYGEDHEKNLVIPTVWANIGPVLDATDPSGDTSTDPSLPVWAQILNLIGDLDELSTQAKENLVAAINEAARTGGGGTAADVRLDVYDGYIRYSTDGGETWENLISVSNLIGPPGEPGTDATVTAETIQSALGYHPADSAEVDQLKQDLAEQQKINADQDLEIEKLKAAAEGHLYMFKQDATEAYEKPVPVDAMQWATLDKIGGRTLVWNQMVGADTTSVSPAAERKYCTRIGGVESIITSDGTSIAVSGGTDMVFDLTVMFGAGNEPSTPEEFRALFPADYYPYSEPTLMNFSNAAVVSRGKNQFDMDEVQTDNRVVNGSYSRWNLHKLKPNTTYTPKLWKTRNYTAGGIRYFAFNGDVHGLNVPEDQYYKNCRSFTTGPNGDFWIELSGCYGEAVKTRLPLFKNQWMVQVVECPALPTEYTPYRSITYDTSTIVQKYFPDGMKSAGTVHDEIDWERMVAIQRVGSVNETGLAYAVLDTPIETPITEAFDSSIEAEAGGTLTFENDQGADFHVPVPNQETFMIKLPGGATE